ncbi:uncharacterized protein FA14DRAFT_182828 [Meira miltonrushii]|uniref:Uncharacterized protein n=1 Tax=Meira miltonrushii TaxID=1280837 RepID=A0A316V4Z6_9BASI|nr:uncharacterized protein FA14DRAFT_182828 [Meira miltonrushii]PWN31303.1 hypothetical protein FA14DRAFT_182828 [Meira miltonrushii]
MTTRVHLPRQEALYQTTGIDSLVTSVAAALAALNGIGGAGYASIDSTMGRHRVSPVVAGVIGAMVTLAVVVIALLLAFLGKSLLGKKNKSRNSSQNRPLYVYNSRDGQNTISGSSHEKSSEHEQQI